jgi:hypothetical protein
VASNSNTVADILVGKEEHSTGYTIRLPSKSITARTVKFIESTSGAIGMAASGEPESVMDSSQPHENAYHSPACPHQRRRVETPEAPRAPQVTGADNFNSEDSDKDYIDKYKPGKYQGARDDD